MITSFEIQKYFETLFALLFATPGGPFSSLQRINL